LADMFPLEVEVVVDDLVDKFLLVLVALFCI
jgi:hypothetical protein